MGEDSAPACGVGIQSTPGQSMRLCGFAKFSRLDCAADHVNDVLAVQLGAWGCKLEAQDAKQGLREFGHAVCLDESVEVHHGNVKVVWNAQQAEPCRLKKVNKQTSKHRDTILSVVA